MLCIWKTSSFRQLAEQHRLQARTTKEKVWQDPIIGAICQPGRHPHALSRNTLHTLTKLKNIFKFDQYTLNRTNLVGAFASEV